MFRLIIKVQYSNRNTDSDKNLRITIFVAASFAKASPRFLQADITLNEESKTNAVIQFFVIGIALSQRH